ncbi:hybrid sensor histidine kinase/response regulator [Sphingomonas sp. 37zxx]|uniref:hybrid sensor histidine kinase/response regulator n=1 Tax=Sphingomonas sp. 37zxx TaxID=1550073 RepID=UPI00053BE138|nr:NahK/ErcS family hybrid sensor histidine kinase/response regulator [Sphingomonas sp. 37zxx]
MASAAELIDPAEARIAALEAEVTKLRRINAVLMNRVERSMDLQGNAFSLFETAITLEGKVQERTRDLEHALDALASTNGELITARDAARDAQRRLADAIESINEGFAIFDAEDRLVLCNQTYLSFWPKLVDRITPGIKFADLARMVGEGTALGAIISPDRWISERLAQHSVADGSHVHALADGRWIQINELRTSEGGIVGVYTDITEVKASDARERAREQAQKSLILQATLDNIRLGVCVYDTDRRLTAWNHPLLVVIGLPDDAIPGIATHAGLVATCTALNGPMEPEQPLGWLPQGAVDVVSQRRHASGRLIEVRRSSLADGGMVMSFEDITERSRREEVRWQANQTLERRVEERTADIAAVNVELQQQIAERQAVEEALREAKTAAEEANLSKTRFLAAASHDLLQPLNAARLFASALSERRLAPTTHILVRQVESALDSVEDLLEALLEISKLDAGAIRPNVIDFGLAETMRSMAAEFQPLADERGLTLTFDDCDAWITSDPRLLRRIVQNFISNALRYTDNGHVAVRCYDEGSVLRIAVEDSGPGIAPAFHREIFTEFRRLDHDTPSRGIGLGLAIVERASRMLGHRLQLVSSPGAGSIFSVLVPRAASRVTHAKVPVQRVRGGLAGRNILVIDNEATILLGMQAILSGWGCTPICVPDRAQAIAAFGQADRPIDAIVADYHLDQGDTGAEAVQAMFAAAARCVPTIIITADRAPELKDRLTAQGFHCLTKPVKPAQLRALLSQLVR